MDAFGGDPFGTSLHALGVDVYTDAYRVSGTLHTRFTRVAEILNLFNGSHLPLEQATISEYTDPSATLGVPRALVKIDEILLLAAPTLDGGARPEMRIDKRPVRAQLAMSPFRVTGLLYVPHGTRPTDGLLNMSDRFIPMTDATIASGAHPELTRSAGVVAVQRDRCHVLVISDEERPDELLADVVDERTAEAWLHPALPPTAPEVS